MQKRNLLLLLVALTSVPTLYHTPLRFARHTGHYNAKSTGKAINTGGDKEARTPGLSSAIAALYQLSYIPKDKANDIIPSQRCKGSIFAPTTLFAFGKYIR